MTTKPSSTNEGLESESETKVDLGTTQTSAADYNMRRRQTALNAGDKGNGEGFTSM